MKEYFKNFTEKDISYMLYGFFLGDGSYRNGTLTIRHTNKQKFYVLWIKEICDILNLKYDGLLLILASNSINISRRTKLGNIEILCESMVPSRSLTLTIH